MQASSNQNGKWTGSYITAFYSTQELKALYTTDTSKTYYLRNICVLVVLPDCAMRLGCVSVDMYGQI